MRNKKKKKKKNENGNWTKVTKHNTAFQKETLQFWQFWLQLGLLIYLSMPNASQH